jgi:hypothetical protein
LTKPKTKVQATPGGFREICKLDDCDLMEKVCSESTMKKGGFIMVMCTYPSHELQYETYMEWSKYLTRFPWQWHCSLTLEPDTKFFYALRLFNSWRVRLIEEEKLRIGAYLLSAYKRGKIHFHALLLGRNKYGKCLHDCNKKRWEGEWRFNARVKTIKDNARVCDYVAKHYLGFKSIHTEIESFDQALLRQVMRRQNDGLDNMEGLLADER